jgi:preprotein translocase subunit SecF
MFIVNHRKLFFALSGLLVVASIISVFVFGLKLGTDFVGGSILEVSYVGDGPTIESAREGLGKIENLGGFSLRSSGNNGFILRSKEVSVVEKEQILKSLSENGAYQLTEDRFNSIGPVVGAELKQKSIIALSVVVLGIVLFITFAFRKVSRPVSSWKYGAATIVALFHDIIIPTGAYVVLGHFFGFEIDLLFVTALLAILGYSVHDTIVVFDRVRENLRHNQDYNTKEEFDVTVGKSLVETMGRSINTSVTLIIVLVVLFLIGSESTRSFSLILLIGAIVGTYSSIFVASPLLVALQKLQKNTTSK